MMKPKQAVVAIRSEPETKEFGLRYVKLGIALMTPDTHIRDIAGLAWDCGLEIHFDVKEKAKKP